MKKLVVFDLDGTLLDTAESLQICMNLALKENSLSPITLEQTRAFVGNGAYLFSLRACKDESLAKAVYESFMRIYSA
ncbi:MAG: HAD hydrolase-like protein, partial [Clostridia bacterium]|nr:HAD hydrolase-like protein [Clostridia bacterium]